jgi:plasmid replication initiation protein
MNDEAEIEWLRKHYVELVDELEKVRAYTEAEAADHERHHAEVERLQAWQDEIVKGYEFESADEMLAWVRTAIADEDALS